MDKIKHLLPEGYTFELNQKNGQVILKNETLDAQAQEALDKSEQMVKYKKTYEAQEKAYKELIERENEIKVLLGQGKVMTEVNNFMKENNLSFSTKPVIEVVDNPKPATPTPVEPSEEVAPTVEEKNGKEEK